MESLLNLTKPPRRLFGRAAVISMAVALLAAHPGVRAQGGQTAEHWVGTWAASEVGRPQMPPPPAAPAPGPRAPQGPPSPAPLVPPFMHFNNQTLRQIVHTSLGGNRARVVLSNPHEASAAAAADSVAEIVEPPACEVCDADADPEIETLVSLTLMLPVNEGVETATACMV